MGWDAKMSNWPLNRDERKYFRGLSLAVAASHNGVDGDLEAGGLDCSACGRALERATGLDAWRESWTADEVRRADKHATWPPRPDWATASARAFLMGCAKFNRGITFSW